MKRHPGPRNTAVSLGGLSAFVLVSIAATTNASQLTDDFSTTFDYSGGAVQGIWDGSYNMGNLAGGLFGSNFFAAEQLTVDDVLDNSLGWEGGRSTAPFLFTDVEGNQGFEATIKIAEQTSGFWSAAGLIARAKQGTPPGTGADNDDEHFTALYSFRTDDANANAGTTLHKRIENGAQLNDINVPINADGDEPLPIWVRLERLRVNNSGPIVYQGSVSTDGATWQLQSTVTPTGGSPLVSTHSDIEVGVSYMNFGNLAGTAKFDDFVLQHTGLIPEPATLGLLLVGGLLGACGLLRRRQ